MCGACGARQLVPLFVTTPQKHATHRTELVLFLTPGIDQSERELEELLRPQIETSNMAYLNEDNSFFQPIQLQTVLLSRTLSSLSSIATATPDAAA